MRILIFFLLVVNIYADIIFLASFNSLHLGWKGKDYKKTAKVLYQFDIIGLQEVMNERGLENLKKELEFLTHENWDYLISDRAVGSEKYKEHYAYIWKEKSVSLIDRLGYYKEENDEDFLREPYGASFKSGNFDFTFVLNHIIYGDRKAQRVNEIEKLNLVYEYFQKKNGTENDLIIAGDFNLKADDKAFSKLLDNKDEIYYVADTSYKTTIGKKGLSSSYDNIFFTMKYLKEFTGKYGVYDFTKDNYAKLRKEVSDHLPVFMQIKTDMEDDD